MLRVRILNENGRLPITKAKMADLVRSAAPRKWLGAGAVDVVFTDDASIGELNRTFLGREGPTDVMAFDLTVADSNASAAEAARDNTLGEVVISTETARRVASEKGHTFSEELALYIVHGMAHLAGYDDTTLRQQKRMYERERRVLLASGFNYVR
jgi:probable rRNA maturation factor